MGLGQLVVDQILCCLGVAGDLTFTAIFCGGDAKFSAEYFAHSVSGLEPDISCDLFYPAIALDKFTLCPLDANASDLCCDWTIKEPPKTHLQGPCLRVHRARDVVLSNVSVAVPGDIVERISDQWILDCVEIGRFSDNQARG